jgi:hypothetical protein
MCGSRGRVSKRREICPPRMTSGKSVPELRSFRLFLGALYRACSRGAAIDKFPFALGVAAMQCYKLGEVVGPMVSW